MIKKLLIALTIIVVLAVAGWYFFLRGSSSPIAQTLNNALPFGNTPSETSASGGLPASFGTTTPSGVSAPTSKLFEVSSAPVAGVASLIKSGTLVVRYVERGTGHIYDVDPTNLQKTEIVNTTVPKVYKAIFTPDGTHVAFQTLPDDGDAIQTTIYTLVPPSGTSTADLYTTKASFLPANIEALSVASTSIAYIQKGSQSVYSAGLDGTKPTIVYNSPFTEWQLERRGGSTVLTTNASADVPGYSYIASGGTISKLFGPNNGLSVLVNNALTRALYFTSENGDDLFAKNISTGSVTPVAPVTLPEKCVWSVRQTAVVLCGAPSQGLEEGEPDLWYQGVSHYSDRVWRFNADTEAAELLVDPKNDFNIDIDTENLTLSPDESYLFFINKNDLSLWALKL